MIVVFYAASLQLIVTAKEGKHIFPEHKGEGDIYVKVDGDWAKGFSMMPCTYSDYLNRPAPSYYFKPYSSRSQKNTMFLVNIGWGTMEGVRRSTYNCPSRGDLDVKLEKVNGKAALLVPPVLQVKQLPNSMDIYADRKQVAEPVTPKPVRAPWVGDPVVEPEPADLPSKPGYFLFKKPERPVFEQRLPPVKPEVTPQSAQVAAQPQPIPAQDLPKAADNIGGKSVLELKNLASELNKSLLANPNLVVDIKDGLLVLAEEEITYEEF